MSQSYPNIIWLLVDSVRTYRGTGDDRDRLDFMDEFAQQAVEFRHVVTSAPSTVMAISALMSGVPSYLLARNYLDFRFDTEKFPTLASILSSQGYECYGLFRHPATREKFLHTIQQPRKSRWLPHLSHIDWWSNEDISMLSRKLFSERDTSKPLFIFHHYNCRHDPNISNLVKDQYSFFVQHGMDSSNTIFILCSDHGYPDPQRGYSPEVFKEREMTHDMLMSNDNILIPLFLQYPGCPQGKKVDLPTSSLDIFPTILEAAGLKDVIPRNEYVGGRSLIDLINDRSVSSYSPRFMRSDSRLMLQDNRATAVTNGRYKYVYLYDEQPGRRELFCDLQSDPLEHQDISDSKDPQILQQLEIFRTEFEKAEAAAVSLQQGYLGERFRASMTRVLPQHGAHRIFVSGNVPERYLMLLEKILCDHFPQATIDIFGSESTKDGNVRVHHISTLDEAVMLSASRPYSLVLTLLPSRYALGTRSLFGQVRKVHAQRYVALDYNMDIYSRKSFLYYKFLSVLDKKQYIVDEPRILLLELRNIFRALFTNMKRELGFIKVKPAQTPPSKSSTAI